MKSRLNLLIRNLVFAFILATLAVKAGAQAIPAHPGFDSLRAVKETAVQNKRYAEALSKGDSTALSYLYSKDAILLNDGSPSTIGHAAIRHFYAGMIRHGVTTFSFITTNLSGSDNNLVGEDGTLTFALASGKVVAIGSYLLVWKRENGELKNFPRQLFC